MGKQKVLIVSNRLPITVGKQIKRSSGGLVSALEGTKDHFGHFWMGWPGTYIKDKNAERQLRKTLLDQLHCCPVFLTAREVSDYYHGFSNSCLWPALHYFPQYIRYHQSWWDAYVRVNERFAREIISQTKDQDYVWIHDYHLCLAPRMVKKANPRLKIGFFLHTPFPSYEVFRCLPHREELLEGLLGADLIGFQTYGYLRHFRSSVIRLLNLESDLDRIRVGDHFCRWGVFPIGINSGGFLKELKTKQFQSARKRLLARHSGHQIVLSLERLDYTKGILRRLEAIDKFLSGEKKPAQVSFVFISIPSRGEVKEYVQLKEMVETTVGRINGEHGTVDYAPVQFIHSTVSFTDLCAIYAIADVAMVTPLVDGMNLVAKEFLACQGDDDPGVLLLSEFAGAANELFDAVIVNPYDIESVVVNLRRALAMPVEERRRRVKAMKKHVIQYDAKYWAEMFIGEMVASSGTVEAVPHEEGSMTLAMVRKKIDRAKKTAWFIDYDGTLREFENEPGQSVPTREIHDILRGLGARPQFDVFVISGRKARDLEDWLGGLPVTLIAEHGYCFRDLIQKQWRPVYENLDFSWRDKVREILQAYVATTPGSFIEEKEASLVWHYRQSDPEFGAWKAQNLIANLYDLLVNQPAGVHHGKRIVEISPIQVNKGAAVQKFIHEKGYDCVVCSGDDKTDEAMFVIDDPRLISIKIGKGETRAGLRLISPQVFRQFLHSLNVKKQSRRG